MDSPPKQVLYITRAKLSLFRAHTQNILKTAEYLEKNGTFVITVFSSAPEQKTKETIFEEKGINQNFDLDISTHRRSMLLYLVRHRQNFQILYFRDPFLWYLGALSRYIFGKKVVFEVHGNKEWFWMRPFWSLACLVSHALIFITNRLKSYYHRDRPSLVVPPAGYEPEDFKPELASKALREKLGLPTDRKIVLYAGSFLWNSAEILVSMISLLSDIYVLVLIGLKKEEKNQIEKFAQKIGVANRVFAMPRSKPTLIPQYLAVSDFLVNPLNIELAGSISSKLYEYIAAGKSIVTTRGGANDELLRDRENALFARENSAKAFARSIEELNSNPELANRIAFNAARLAKNYTWEARARSIERFLDKGF